MPVLSTLPIHLKGVYEVMIARGDTMPNYWKWIVGKKINTTAIAEKMVLLTGLATATRTGDGAAVLFDEITSPYDKTFYTDEYAIGVEFTEKQVKTDQSGKLKRFGEEFAYSLNVQLETMVADVINNGTDGTNYAGIDGVALFSASHPTVGGTTWSNLSTAATMSIDSLEQLMTDRKSHRTLKDQPWTKLVPCNLIYGEALEMKAARLLGGIEQPETPDREINVVKRSLNASTGNQYLTDTNAYTAIPRGDANPIFLLEGNIPKPIRQDYDPRVRKELMVAAQDHTTGWMYPAGIQHNIGA